MAFFSLARSPRLRIRAYLLLLMLGSAAPLVLLSGILVGRTGTTQVESFGRDAVAVARALSLGIDSRITSLQSVLEALGRSRALADGDLMTFCNCPGRTVGFAIDRSRADVSQGVDGIARGHSQTGQRRFDLGTI